MDIGNGQGQHKKELKKKNRARIKAFFKENPGATQMECSKELELGYQTVLAHVRAIQKEKK